MFPQDGFWDSSFSQVLSQILGSVPHVLVLGQVPVNTLTSSYELGLLDVHTCEPGLRGVCEGGLGSVLIVTFDIHDLLAVGDIDLLPQVSP